MHGANRIHQIEKVLEEEDQIDTGHGTSNGPA